jgi:signal transduction histidine kinase
MSKMLRTHGDILLAAGFSLAAILEVLVRGEPAPALLAPGLLAAGSLAWRVRAPVPVLALNLAASLAVELLAGRDDYPLTLGLVLLLSIYSAAAHTLDREETTAGVLLVVSVPVLIGAHALDYDMTQVDGRTNLSIGFVFLVITFRSAWLAGKWMQRRRERVRALIAAREEKARAALREERLRIARDLHDVLAHAISVIVLQARGARHALPDPPEEARDAIAAIERTASQALAEMRRLLTVLRDDDAVALAPQPSLAQIEHLAAEVRAAGLPVELQVEGPARELPTGADLCAYRIVQEALTNTLKHAGTATARVVVRYRADALEVEVGDTGEGGNGDLVGLGIAGMRERVAMFGGILESGPGPDGGYLVKARLPL